MQYHTIEQIGPKRARTSHGAMLCQDVPIARTGLQLYGPGETPITQGAADLVRIERDEEEVFHPLCIASLHGAPVVNDHPMSADGDRMDVTSDNWRDLAIGHVINPRRGEGVDDDVLLADLLIWDKDAIALIDSGKRELSVGYDADYDEIGPGLGRQKNIRANHVALVERGRCGPRCAIGDNEYEGICCEAPPSEEDREMATRAKTSWADKIRAAFKARDESALDAALATHDDDDDDKDNAPEVHVHNHMPDGNGADDELPKEFQDRMRSNDAEHEEMWDAIESIAGGSKPGDAKHRDARRLRDGIRPRDRNMKDQDKEDEDKTDDELGGAPGNKEGKGILPGFEMEAPPGTKLGDARRARDSALFEDSFAETLALAEILVPGVRLPTYDRAAAPKKTFDAICAFRSRVLDLAFAQPDTREIIDSIMGGRFDSARNMTCDAAKMLFKAVADAKARANKANLSGSVDLVFGGGVQPSGTMQSPADLQKTLDKYYADQRAARR